MKESYGTPPQFKQRSLDLIELCDNIITDYVAQGYRLTIRQLYYQLVARGEIENTVRSYDNTVVLMTNARLAGLIDWDAIEDRTRDFIDRSHWDYGSEVLTSAANSFHQDMWQDQDYRLFVVVEKEALAGVLERVCKQWDVPLLPARGYPSATALREFAKEKLMPSDQEAVILHLGDHDPSGIDMSRDLIDRLELFTRGTKRITFKRIALNMDQIKEQSPPPNPAKVTDSRYEAYRRKYGEESWELDALSPQYLHKLVEDEIDGWINFDLWDSRVKIITEIKSRIHQLAKDFDE